MSQIRAADAPAGPAVPLIDADRPADAGAWAADHRELIRAAAREHGSALVRGLGVRTPEDVGRVAGAVGDHVAAESEGFAARTRHADGVYSSAAWPADQPMCMHHEQSYGVELPGLLLLGCLTAASDGGGVGLADSEAVLRALPATLVDRFDALGWLLTRNYHELLGGAWARALGTGDRGAAEAWCRARDIEAQWMAGDALRTRQRRFAVVEHPTTGRRCWFNQIAFLNEWTMDPAVREYLVADFGPDGLPFNTAYGTGEPIGPDVIGTINDVYAAHTTIVPLCDGDLLVVDNVRMAHSRTPFRGPREVVVAMADPVEVTPFSPAADRRLRYVPGASGVRP